MVHSVELLFDPDTESAIRLLWESLAGQGIPSQAPASRPHVTLTVANRISPDVDSALVGVAGRLPFECVVGAPVLFGRSSYVLARLIVPSAEQLAVQAEVHRLCRPHMVGDPYPNTLPGDWTAHVTLARHVGGATLSKALRIAGRPLVLRGSFSRLRRWEGDKRTEHAIAGPR
jgi:hypothetical protein